MRIHTGGSVHLVMAKPGEMLDVHVMGDDVKVVRSPADEHLLRNDGRCGCGSTRILSDFAGRWRCMDCTATS
jgi:hypothetical protein